MDERVVKVTKTLNAKGRVFSWSYTALVAFENCPASYAAARFYCTSPFQESAATIWGSRVHKAAELAIKGKDHKDPEAFAPVAPYVSALKASGHFLEAETEITLNENLDLTGWFAKDAWLRCKLDVVVTKHHPNTAVLYDWKTGKIKEGDDQLRICAAALEKTRAGIDIFEGKYIWTKFKQVTGIKPIKREEIPQVWENILPRVARMQAAWDADNFPAKPSGLCPYCPVTNCLKRR